MPQLLHNKRWIAKDAATIARFSKIKRVLFASENCFPLAGRAEGARLTRVCVIIGRATPERSRDYVSLRELGYFAGY